MDVDWKVADPRLRSLIATHWEHPDTLLTPAWLERLTIRELPLEASEGAVTLAQVDAMPEYHHAIIYFSPALLQESDEIVRRTIVHELIHIHLSPLEAVIDSLSLEDPMQTVMTKQLEFAVTSLERTLEKLLENHS